MRAETVAEAEESVEEDVVTEYMLVLADDTEFEDDTILEGLPDPLDADPTAEEVKELEVDDTLEIEADKLEVEDMLDAEVIAEDDEPDEVELSPDDPLEVMETLALEEMDILDETEDIEATLEIVLPLVDVKAPLDVEGEIPLDVDPPEDEGTLEVEDRLEVEDTPLESGTDESEEVEVKDTKVDV